MADSRDLETRIKSAEKSLNEAFGIPENQEGQGTNRFLDLESLISAYKEESSRKEITQQFLSIAKSVRNMRSSYLPIDFFINNETGRFDADLAAKVAPQESYENAFMRMLGMPSVASTEFGLTSEDSEIRSSQNLKIIDPMTGDISDVSFEEVKRQILNERQKTRDSRRILIDNSIYDVSETILNDSNTISIRNLSLEEVANLLGTVVDQATGQLFDPSTGEIATFFPTEISRDSESDPYLNPFTGSAIPTSSIQQITSSIEQEEKQAKIATIAKDFWKFSYLLVPPIQSVEITKAINEPSKIVIPPFTSGKNIKINDAEIRPTLLESVIRIRLDKVSGTSTFVSSEQAEADSFSIEVSVGSKDEAVEVIEDDFGILEALFILRLRSAISGLAQKLYSDIDIILAEIEKAKRLPAEENDLTGQATTSTSLESVIQFQNTESQAIDGDLAEETLTLLQQQKLIEDSILFLLGDNSEVLDLQTQTQRKSSIYNSHMMSGLISVIDVPRQRIEEEVSKIVESRNNTASLAIEQKTQEIGVVLGTDIGIGTIDLAVFALALFTLSEKSLLGLLSTAQFERMKNGSFKSLISATEEKVDTVDALNEFTQLIVDGYKVFIKDLEDDARID